MPWVTVDPQTHAVTCSSKTVHAVTLTVSDIPQICDCAHADFVSVVVCLFVCLRQK